MMPSHPILSPAAVPEREKPRLKRRDCDRQLCSTSGGANSPSSLSNGSIPVRPSPRGRESQVRCNPFPLVCGQTAPRRVQIVFPCLSLPVFLPWERMYVGVWHKNVREGSCLQWRGLAKRVNACTRQQRTSTQSTEAIPRAKEKNQNPQGVSRASIRKTPLHVPDRGAHIRQGLSHMFYVPTTPEGVTCSPLSGNHLVPDVSPPFSTCVGSTLVSASFSWALRRHKVSR